MIESLVERNSRLEEENERLTREVNVLKDRLLCDTSPASNHLSADEDRYH